MIYIREKIVNTMLPAYAMHQLYYQKSKTDENYFIPFDKEEPVLVDVLGAALILMTLSGAVSLLLDP